MYISVSQVVFGGMGAFTFFGVGTMTIISKQRWCYDDNNPPNRCLTSEHVVK